MSDSVINASIRTDVAHINLRGDASNANFRRAVEKVLEQPLPQRANTLSQGEHCVYWLGPDEWLLLTERHEGLVARLTDSLATLHAAVNDVSGGNVAVRLSGDRTRDLFAKGCTLDFQPDVFGVGDCAQSGLAKAIVLIGLVDDEPAFDVIVRRSFSAYLLEWLRHAGREYGIEFR